MNNNTTGNSNAAYGYDALYGNNGNNNTAIGRGALSNNFTGDNNVAFGFQSGFNSLGDANVYLGYNAGYNETGSNKLYIENSNSTTPLIYGEFDNDLLRVNGTLNINNAFSFPITDGTANQILQTDGAGNLTWQTATVGATDEITDADNNTKVQVEETANEDVIRFDVAGTEKMIINSTSVRINETTEVFGSGRNRLTLQTNDNTLENGIAFKNSGAAYAWSLFREPVSGDETRSSLVFSGGIPSNDPNTLSEQMRISNTGNVGINTNNPDEKLHVVGNIKMVDGNQALGKVLTSDANGVASWQTNNAGTIQNSIADADNNTKIQVEETANEDIIRFDMAGTEYFRMDGGRLEVLNTGNSVFIGENAGANDDLSSNENIYIGKSAGENGTIAYHNIALGTSALLNNNGDANIGIGSGAGFLNQGGESNILIGASAGAGSSLHDKYNNVMIGREAGTNNNGSGNVFLGYQSGQNESGSNKLYIENTNSTTPLIYGEFNNDLLRVNGTLNINNAFSFPITDGTANQILQTDGSGNLTWQTNTGAIQNSITDADNNTKIQVEETTNDDIIRFDIGGVENFKMSQNSGNTALLEIVNNNGNISIGENTGTTLDNSSAENILIGKDVGNSVSNGSNNVMIGYQAGFNNNGDRNVFLGTQAGASASANTNSDQLRISNPTGDLIYGEFDNNLVRINGTLETTSSIKVGNNGTAISNIIKVDVTNNVGSISSDGTLNVDFSVPGAETGSSVMISPSADLPNQVFIGQARVQSNGVVRVRFYNESNSSKDPASMTYYITVIK